MILSKILLLLSFFNLSDSVDHMEIAPVQLVTSYDVVISDSLFTGAEVSLDLGTLKGWKFSPQDNPEFSSPDYEDSHWYKFEKTPSETFNLPDSLWQGFGWLRLRIRIDPALSNSINIIYQSFYLGASELYINGCLVMSHGVPGVTAGEEQLLGSVLDLRHNYEFLPGETYLIAVKYSMHNLATIRHLSLGRLRTPFLLNVDVSNYETIAARLENSIIFTSIFIFAATILLLVMMLHLFMYLYVSDKKASFAIMVLSSCLILLSGTLIYTSFSIRNFWFFFILTSTAPPLLITISGSLVPWVTYQVLGVPLPLFWKRFILVPLMLILLLALFPAFYSDGLVYSILSIIFIAAITGSILAIIKARKMKKKGIGIVAGSLLVYPLLYIIMVAVSVIFKPGIFWSILVLFFMLVSMPVGMSIQQAKKFLQLHLQLDFLVRERTAELSKSLSDLRSTQSQLIQSEKMASLGQLTAGIAHEIQNPLNFVNNFSDVNKELLEELKEEADKGNFEEVKSIANDVIGNEQKINHHGKRADAIVKGMLQHSRSNSGHKEPTDINALADEYLRLSYHGMRAKDKSFNADFKLEADKSLPKIEVVPQDIGRVLLNLINNAFYAVAPPPPPAGGGIEEQRKDYKPTVTVRTASWNPPSGGRGALISVIDNGPGIPPHIVDKIFQPF